MGALEVSRISVGTREWNGHRESLIHKGWYEGANDEGGVGVALNFYNASGKTIKYIWFGFVPYNRVGDEEVCSKTGVIGVRSKFTGPVNAQEEKEIRSGILWYNFSISSVKVEQIIIQYMDGTEETLEEKDIGYMYADNSAYHEQKAEERAERERERAKEEAERKRRTAEYEKKKAEEEAERKRQIAEYEKEKAEEEAERKRQYIQSEIKHGSEALKYFDGKPWGGKEYLDRHKGDEETLLKMLDGAFYGMHVNSGYLLGDYIEQEHSSNEKLMKKAIAFWKHSIEFQQKYPNDYHAGDCKGFPVKYAEKIRKYEPEYVMPKKAGCMGK